MPAHPVARALLAAAAVPIAAPSANRFAQAEPDHAPRTCSPISTARIDLVLDGGRHRRGRRVDDRRPAPWRRRSSAAPAGSPSSSWRPSFPELGLETTDASVERAQLAPGQLLRHYAPAARLTVYSGDVGLVVGRLTSEARHHAAAGQRVGILAPDEDLVAMAPSLAASAAHGRIVVASLRPAQQSGRRRRDGCSPPCERSTPKAWK